MKLFMASVFTIILLSGFLFATLMMFLYFTGNVSILLVFALTIMFNFILWLAGPAISDWMYKFFYKIEWITIKDLRKKSPKTAGFVERTCEKYGFNVPKLGLIDDKNPNAFTYGSGRWNSRLVLTQGIFEYLDENERMAVAAHELGHIKNRDFIVMTIASTLLQLLYQISMSALRPKLTVASGKSKGKGAVALLGIAAYVLYWIGSYAVLYLSRTREYYADEFSAKETNPNYLSSALIRISYGIFSSPDNKRLVESTKHMGITDFKLAKSTGLAFHGAGKDIQKMGGMFLYDFKNPWAFISELNSTHPLTGKRIKRLCSLSQNPIFDFEKIESSVHIDKGRMYSNFFKDFSATLLPIILIALYPVLYLLSVYFGLAPLTVSMLFGGWFIAAGVGLVLLALYKYPSSKYVKTDVFSLMSDPYASPVRGQPVELDGKIVGRGIAGYKLSEDMMMQDKTGLMFLNYESWLPLIGNLLFGYKKVAKLIGKNAKVSGWFFRGISHSVGLKEMSSGGEKIKGYLKLGSVVGGLLIGMVGVLFLMFVPV